MTEKMIEAAKAVTRAIYILAVDIRNDWNDPRGECRLIWEGTKFLERLLSGDESVAEGAASWAANFQEPKEV